MTLAGEPPREWIAVGSNRVRFLRDGAVAFPAMLQAIASAKREVLLEMYWLAADRVGEQFRSVLVERARAGVRVAVVLDAFGSFETPRSFLSPLVAAGAEVLLFSLRVSLERDRLFRSIVTTRFSSS
jgi:cardiolipin synthase